MGVSIYYEARRRKPLTRAEFDVIEELIEEYSGRHYLYEKIVDEWRGESFHWSLDQEPTHSDTIFEGATKLPSNLDHLMAAGDHWFSLLSAIRREIADANWAVHIDDHDVYWDDATQQYNPSAPR